mmetsp:Transcript_10988/g.34677  ORF Transcript_10988/g.34677 Transcript_10988/m.34677 type:complete len:411 (+) Transcript_10988:108-1340(+)
MLAAAVRPPLGFHGSLAERGEDAFLLSAQSLAERADLLGPHPVGELADAHGLHREAAAHMDGLVPLEPAEEGVAFDVRRPIFQVAKAARDVALQQAADQAHPVCVHPLRVGDLAREDLLVCRHVILRLERRAAGQKLVEQDSERPIVCGFVVPLLEHNLRREVLGRAAERPSAVEHLLGEAKIGQLDRAIVRDEKVLKLEVAMDEGFVVHVLEREEDLRDVDARVVKRELPRRLQLVVQVASWRELENEVEVGDRLKSGHLVGNARVVELVKHLALLQDMLHLPRREDFRLGHLLDRVELAARLDVRASHLAKRTLAKHFARQVEVCKRHRHLLPLDRGRRAVAVGARDEPVGCAGAQVVGDLLPPGIVLSHLQQRVDGPEQPLERAPVHPDELARRVRGDRRDRRRARS